MNKGFDFFSNSDTIIMYFNYKKKINNIDTFSTKLICKNVYC